MKRKLAVIALAGCLVLAWATMAAATLGSHAQPAWGTEGDCAVCHNVSQTAKLRGWGLDLTGVPNSNWLDNRPISKLCWSCHRNGTTKPPASDMFNFAFYSAPVVTDPEPHSYTEVEAPYPPEPTPAARETYDHVTEALPYLSAGDDLLECTSCHNVHVYEKRPFRMKGLDGRDFSELCNACHANRANPSNVGTLNTNASGYSVHPTNVPMLDNPANGFSNILTVAAMDARLKAPIADNTGADSWALGGKLTLGETGDLTCGTCHRVHGDELESLVFNKVMLSIDSYEVDHSPLCVGCHGLPVGNDPATDMTDHPLHGSIPNRTFYPSSFVTANGVPIEWRPGAARNGYGATVIDTTAPENGNAGSDPSCSSCHDVHGGVGGTSLWYAPDNGVLGGYHWCFNCHPISAVTPPYHHSNIWNDDDFPASGASVLDCGHCHGTSAGGYWQAHNGFWDFTGNTAISNTDSAICEYCHTDINPTLLVARGYDPASVVWPARHAPNNMGTDSHLVGATFGIDNVVSFAGDWIGQADGDYAAPYDRDPVDVDFPVGVWSQWGATGDVLCESCHNILENCGTDTAGPDMLGGGWKMNLLLLAYEDDDAGNRGGVEEIQGWDTVQTGDRFCRICHNLDLNDPPDGIGDGIGIVGTGTYVHYPAAHTVETYNYGATTPYGRPTATLLTTYAVGSCPDTSTADTTAATVNGPGGVAPNNFSYPDDNQINCDSCHRPHNGYTAAAAVGGGETGHVIIQDVAAEPKTGACYSCHDDQVMCGQ